MPLRAARDVGDGQRRRIRCEDTVFVHDGFDLLDDTVLETQVFENRLDDDVAVLEAAIIGLADDAGHRLIALERRHRLAFRLLVEVGEDPFLPVGEALHRNVLHADADALLCGDECDARAHESGAEHADALHVDVGLAEAILLERGLAEEERHQALRFGRHREFAEAA